MPQVSAQDFERLPLRVHTFLAGVPLHDIWSVDLPRWRAGVTLDEFLRTASSGKLNTCSCSKSSSLFTHPLSCGMLLNIRFFVGRLFDWDHEPAPAAWKTFATRLTRYGSFDDHWPQLAREMDFSVSSTVSKTSNSSS